ncbi:SIR2-like domain-containing protein [Psychroflexus salarius]|uniref:SIR2-like domain-containing protein n=1 Tax=Psychroflexus salarius TaxID=1155689 RepID=A0A1M4YHK4_9FLAO|nr:SIR2 family protein [Psychroflexus salarius]SHF05123.1 SIR2-like domain-containing protein [Psychroflexus salarius]
MENHLTVILGAGFSANAEMPTASSIADRFDRDLREKLLSASSSEWFWIDDKDETFIHNGRLNYDYIAYSYVFNELVKSYVTKRGSFVYYEDFYQYIIDNFANSDWVEKLFEKSKKSLLTDKPFFLEKKHKEYYKNYLFAFDHKQFHKVSAILNYLIGDILSVIPKTDAEIKEIYKGFVEFISQFEALDIFTLNHDLLLERVFDLNGLKYSKGFNIENSPISHNDKSVPFFNNNFNEKIKIHKLHGSLDFFQFRHYEQIGMTLRPTDNYDYYMTSDYYTKHNSIRINPNTKKILQNYNYDIVPKFITGTKKLDTIGNDILFKKLFQNFSEVMIRSDKLFISGYSFKDEHLNEKLKSKEFKYVNQNPFEKYPFEGNGKNIKNLDELKTVANTVYS